MIFNRILEHVKRSRFQRRIYKYHWKQKPFPFSQAWEKSKKTNSTASPSSLHAATRREETAISCKTVTFPLLPRATRSIHDMQNPQEPKPLQISHLFTRGTGGVLSLSLWVETVYDSGGVRAFRHLFAKRAQRSGGIRDSQQPSGNKEAVGDELYPKNRGALRASARYSCFLGNAAVIPVLPLAYFPPPVENGEPSFNTM